MHIEKLFKNIFLLSFYTLNNILKYFIRFYNILKTNNWHYNYFSVAYRKINNTVVITALKEKSQKKKKNCIRIPVLLSDMTLNVWRSYWIIISPGKWLLTQRSPWFYWPACPCPFFSTVCHTNPNLFTINIFYNIWTKSTYMV